MEQQICPSCHNPILPNYYFCPNCGKKLKEPPPATTIAKQITIYLISFFLPPFGLIPAIKYIMQNEKKAKIIGIVAVFLTILSVIITIWLAIGVVNSFNQTLNSQLNGLQNF